MEQESINQRLKFLADSLAESARAFSDAIKESPTNTHNYISGGRKPSPEYLKSILVHFRNVNAHWLMTGEGEPFLSDAPAEASNTTSNNKKISRSLVTGNVGRDAIHNQGVSGNEAAMKREIELLKEQVADKERMIQLLLSK